MKTSIPLISIIRQFTFAALLLALLSINHVNATTYYAIANGNWNINTTWSLTSGGAEVEAGVWPVAGDIVYISEGVTDRSVTIPSNYSANCAHVYLGGATGTAAILTLAASTSVLYVSGNVTIYGPSADANRYINVNAGTMTVAGNLELGTGQTGPQGGRTCRVVITTGTVSVYGNLVFNNILNSSPDQTYLDMSGGAGRFNLAGEFNIINSMGTLNAGATSTFNFNGYTAGQTIPVGVSSVIFNNININNSHPSGVTLGDVVTATNITGHLNVQNGTFNNGGFGIMLAAAKNFTVSNGATFNLTGTSTMVSVSGGGANIFGPYSNVDYAGTNQVIGSETYGNLLFNGTGIKTMPATCSLLGNWTNNATVDAAANSGTVIFCGATSQQIIDGLNVTSFFDLVLNKPSSLNLGINATITHSLTLTDGIFATGAFILDITSSSTGSVTGGSSSAYVTGRLHRAVASDANCYSFPIGTPSAYAPVSINFKAGTTAGTLQINTTEGDHASIGNTIFNSLRTVNRFWTFTAISGLGTTSYDATFNWAGTDQDPAFAYGPAVCGKFDSGSWTYPAVGTTGQTSVQANGLSGLGDFQIGNTIGPITIAPVVSGCTDNIIQVPVRVTSFFDVGAVSLTMNYDKTVMTYASFENTSGLIDFVYFDESGDNGFVRISGITQSSWELDDYDVLVTLIFNYHGGTATLTFDDSNDIWCEYATGGPNFSPYSDEPNNIFYINGSVSGTTLVADFMTDSLVPLKHSTIQLTDLSTGNPTGWEWSFDRPEDVVYDNGTNANSQNPQVHFTNGGLYTVTLTVHKEFCTVTEVKTDYIRVGILGWWTGETSNNWYTETNWDNHLVPPASADVIIPAIQPGCFNPRVPGNLITTVDCSNVIILGEAVLEIEGELIINPGTAIIVKGTAKIVLLNP